jgi:NAD(P)H-dependent flavin oxidoreductase YrpB (nitropropane dioxygenase family)
VATADAPLLTFDPVAHGADVTRNLTRPRFLAIVAANSLAATLAKRASGRVDGFVVEGPTAGGHNAPARGGGALSATGEPIYGERDAVDLAKMRDLGLPFWLAGGTGSPHQLQHALTEGAAGIQVGTLFAYCDESGFDTALKATVLDHARRGGLAIRTDPRTSPTGFPFKVVSWPGHPATMERTRRCDLGYLRAAYHRDDGRVGYRCPAEPEQDFVNKGGLLCDTVGRQCVCNGLIAAVGLPQAIDPDAHGHREEPALITSGDELLHIGAFLGDRASYTARDVVEYLQSGR